MKRIGTFGLALLGLLALSAPSFATKGATKQSRAKGSSKAALVVKGSQGSAKQQQGKGAIKLTKGTAKQGKAAQK